MSDREMVFEKNTAPRKPKYTRGSRAMGNSILVASMQAPYLKKSLAMMTTSME